MIVFMAGAKVEFGKGVTAAKLQAQYALAFAVLKEISPLEPTIH
jgi:hypothetical protein